MKNKILTATVLTILGNTVFAQEVPESLLKQNNNENISSERVIIKNEPVQQIPAIPPEKETERFKTNNKPVEQIPTESPEENQDNEKEKELTQKEKKRKVAWHFMYKLNEYGVKTCREPLSQIVRALTDSPNVSEIEMRSNLIESNKVEPVIFTDYAIVGKTTDNDIPYSSMNLSIQAIPFSRENTCLIVETNDTIINTVDDCSTLEQQFEAQGNSIIDEGDFKNQFDKTTSFRRFNNQLITLNDMKDTGCHIRTVSYSQFTYKPETTEEKTK